MMKHSALKNLCIALLIFVYLTSAVGYTAAVHFCRLQHHSPTTAAECCCTHAAAGLACDHHGAQEPLTFENTDLPSADLRLSAPVCCENRIGYRQIEAPTLRAVAAEEIPEPLYVFSPALEQFTSKNRLFTPLGIAFQINLPLLI
ncbi:MAG: hypothetical protein ONB12_09235 [candidate division KSB1 bacterium]|nr:hypothetical protein [candidate division KSB1 bacterium]